MATGRPGRNKRGFKIGILGGSFNPPHEGHVHISRLALKLLGLRQVWWLVTPQNPLKNPGETQPYQERIRLSEKIIPMPSMKVSDFEKRRGLVYTVDTLARLKAFRRDAEFTLIIGSDNLLSFHKWRRWNDIIRGTRLAVFERGGVSSYKALSGKAAVKYSRFRAFGPSSGHRPPCWYFFRGRRVSLSSTLLREQGRF